MEPTGSLEIEPALVDESERSSRPANGHAVLFVSVMTLFAAGCGLLNRPQNLTADFEGRDVDLYAADGPWLVYSWSPPNNLSRPLHLVARNVESERETELEADWYGREIAVSGTTLVYESRTGGESTLIAYDLPSGTSTTLYQGASVNEVQLSGRTVVWEVRNDVSMNVLVVAPSSGEYVRRIEDPGRTPTHSDIRPRLSGSNLVFLRRDPATREYTMMYHDVSTNSTEPLPVTTPDPISLDLSGNWVVYTLRDSNTVHALNLQDRSVRELGDAPRKVNGPVIRGDKVAWIAHVREDEYAPVAGQPLIDERDFRRIHVMSMSSGRVATLIDNRFMVNQVTIDSRGQVYATMPRRITPGSAEQIKDILRF